MKPETVHTVVFSPTGTSKKIAAAVARGIASATGTVASVPLKTIDLTHSAGQPATLPADTVAVIAAPVYGGRVAPMRRTSQRPRRSAPRCAKNSPPGTSRRSMPPD